VGVCFDVAVTDCLKLIGGTNVAFLYGKIHTKNKLHAPVTVRDDFANTYSNVGRGRPTAGANLGIEGVYHTCGYDIGLSASYECQYYWSQWHATSSLLGLGVSGAGQWGDLFLQGLTLSASVAF